VTDARLLVRLLADPPAAARLTPAEWAGLIAMARAELLLGSLAFRLGGLDLPPRVAALLADARADAERARTQALWEAEMARRALAPLGLPVILLKGTAYAAAGLKAGEGRSIGDLDIMVPRDSLDTAQRALLAAGWEWVKEDAYDDLYYRRWMHELPPLIHRERDRMIDVHHNILPLTARPKPDSAAMIADSVELPSGLRMLSPPDMTVHAATHLFADGDLAGGLRNLWDIHRLLEEFGDEGVERRARHHGLARPVARAVRIRNALFSGGRLHVSDQPFVRRLLARNHWGQETRRGLRFAFYVRSHWLRMPPLMLARHLWVKARR
jgi:hypothetical protein